MRVQEATPAARPRVAPPLRPSGPRLAWAFLLVNAAGLALLVRFVALPYAGASHEEAAEPGPADMEWVAGGEVLMPAVGSRPAYWTSVAGFWMDRRDVKEADFARFIDATGYVPAAERAAEVDPSKCDPRRAAEVRHPRGPLPREDADAYAAWIGKRLPTEEEREWIRHEGLVRKDDTPDHHAWLHSLAVRLVKSPR
jgi:formylglycine-generating enzyme required for sulfatase activity